MNMLDDLLTLSERDKCCPAQPEISGEPRLQLRTTVTSCEDDTSVDGVAILTLLYP